MTLVHSPKQSRSQDTQEKLLHALEALLAERFFEQITIRDLAERAGVASGTIYRRFKDKEALLPVLYQRYDQRLREWTAALWEDFDLAALPDVRSRVRHLVASHLEFNQQHVPILRTLYLYMRLHGELSLEDIDAQRQGDYVTLLQPILEASAQTGHSPGVDRVKLFLLVLLTTLHERALFSDVKPVRTLEMDDAVFIDELTTALEAYLRA